MLAADDIKSYVDDSGTTFWFTVSSSGNATIVNETNSSSTSVSEEAPASYEGNIVIPDYVKDENLSYRVKAIGDYAFCCCYDLESVVIPDGVTYIGNYAFYWCYNSNFTSINIPEGVTIIGDRAFYSCQNLVSVEIPNGVTSIGGFAFMSTSITSVVIPGSVTSIGQQCFSYCNSLTSAVFLEGVTSTGEYTFYQSNSLSSVVLSESVTTIGENCFYKCTSLSSVIIPESVTSIGAYAFSDCSNLTPVYFTRSDNISFGDHIFGAIYDNYDVIYYYPKGASASYSGLSSNYSKKMKEIDYSFKSGDLYYYFTGLGSDGTPHAKVIADDSYSTLESVSIPETVDYDNYTFKVTKIGKDAFANAENFNSVTVNWTEPVALSDGAFAGVEAILYVPEGSEDLYHNSEWGEIFPLINYYPKDDDVLKKGDLYYEIISTEDNTVKIINDESYANLEQVEISTEIEFYGYTFSVTSIASNAFANCTSLTVTVSDESAKAISIASDAFSADFEGVLTAPAGLERAYFNSDWSDYFTINGYIEGTQFANGALTYEITDQYTYEVKIVDFECDQKVVIPESVDYDYVYYTITNVDDGVFCSTLKEVVVNASEPTFSADAFSGIASDAVLVVKGDTEAYISAGWGDYFDIYQFAVNGTEFAYNGVAYKITDADNELVQVTGYDSDSFPKNGELVIGTVPYNGVTYTATSIVEKAFYECLALEKITIDGCDIAANNFTNCRSLQSITITNSTINTQTFYDCQMSPDLQITGSTIKTKAFYYATFDNVNIVDCQVEKNAFFADGGFSDGKKLEFQKLKFSNCTFSEDAPFYVSYYYGIIISIEELEFEQCSFGEQLFYSYTVNFQVPLYIQTLKFSDCNELKKTMFDSISFIYITNLEVTATDLADNVFNGNSNGFYTLKITDSVIGQQAFSSCSSLQNAEIIDSQIGLYAFDSCTNLSDLIINNSVINKWAFQNCTALDNLHLLNMTEEFAKESFSGCQSLSKAYIDATVPPSLEDNVFENIATDAILYAPFESINLYAQSTWADYFNLLGFIKDETTGLYFQVIDDEAKTVKVISSVEGSYQYETIEIPSYVGEYKVVEIDQYAFYQTPLTSVVIPETVERIGIYAFYNCYLDYVYCKATVPPTLEDAHYTFNYWYDENSNKVKITLYVPTGCVSAYESSSWYSYSIFDPILEYKELSIETNFVTSPNASIVGYYNLLGQPLNQPAKGINIILYSDGTCKKVLVK